MPTEETPLAKLARLQRAADEATAKVTRTKKDVDTLTKRVAKEQGVADAAQKEFDTFSAELTKQLAPKSK